MKPKAPFYKSWWFILLAVLAFYNLCVMGAVSNKKTDTVEMGNSVNTSPGAVAEQREVSKPAVIEKSCRDIKKVLSREAGTTELQKSEAWTNTFQGKTFTWNLAVVDVKKSNYGGFVVHFICPPLGNNVVALEMTFPDDAKELVLKLTAHKTYAVSGVLKEFMTAGEEDGAMISLMLKTEPAELTFKSMNLALDEVKPVKMIDPIGEKRKKFAAAVEKIRVERESTSYGKTGKDSSCQEACYVKDAKHKFGADENLESCIAKACS